MLNRKAVFFDIDGTLVPYDKDIPESAVSALRQLRENGHLAVLSTGRTRPLIMPEVLKLGFDGIVAGCGSYVEYNGEVVHSEKADMKKLREIASGLIDMGYAPFYESVQGIYYYPDLIGEENKGSAEYYKKLLGDKFMPVNDTMEASKIYSNLHGTVPDLSELAGFQDYFDIHIHGSVAVEIIPKKYNKATGMQYFIEAAGMKRKDTYAVGDSLNDADMIQYAGTGIVMGNAFEEVKKYADYITTDIDDDGIYNALKHFDLI